MTSSKAHSALEAHYGLSWILHDLTIVLNTIHFSLLVYYLLYELLELMFERFAGYPHLPRIVYFKSKNHDSSIVSWLTPIIKSLCLVGALLGLFGSASWKLVYTVLGASICSPFVLYDLYLWIIGSYHIIDVDDFLLFHSLFTTTYRSMRITTTLMNWVVITQVAINPPEGLTFKDFVDKFY